jgi:non-ribosomal peptide synthetase component E (peptide arylation enzyme)
MKQILFSLLALIIACGMLRAQDSNNQDKIMITVFLKHDQDMNLSEIQQQLQENGFWKIFPPDEVEVVSWYVMMGVGQVVTVRLAPAKLRELNLAIENGAWGAFNTEFYATYDYMSVWKEMKEKYK